MARSRPIEARVLLFGDTRREWYAILISIHLIVEVFLTRGATPALISIPSAFVHPTWEHDLIFAVIVSIATPFNRA